MNTYSKFCPNVFLAQCTEEHEKGENILVQTKYGKENECIVFNLIGKKNGFFYYSIVRADGFDFKEHARKKAERLQGFATNAVKKSDSEYNRSHDITKHIPMGQPILVGHHSEGRHRRDLQKSWDAMGKSVALQEKADKYMSRAEYWEARATEINLSMPESIEYYEYKVEELKEKHQQLKDTPELRKHSFSLTYAKKDLNEAIKNFDLAKRLWQ